MKEKTSRNLMTATLAFALFVCLFGPIVAFAAPGPWFVGYRVSESACYNVSDSDYRSMCLARAHRDAGRCYSIQRPDLRQQCLAESSK